MCVLSDEGYSRNLSRQHSVRSPNNSFQEMPLHASGHHSSLFYDDIEEEDTLVTDATIPWFDPKYLASDEEVIFFKFRLCINSYRVCHTQLNLMKHYLELGYSLLNPLICIQTTKMQANNLFLHTYYINPLVPTLLTHQLASNAHYLSHFHNTKFVWLGSAWNPTVLCLWVC